MPWRQITLQALDHAMGECEYYCSKLGQAKGLELFRNRYGNTFQTTEVKMFYPAGNPKQRGPFEARPLIAAAWAYHTQNWNWETNYNGGPLDGNTYRNNDSINFLVSQRNFQRVPPVR